MSLTAACALAFLLPAWGLLSADDGPPDPDPSRFAEAIAAFEEADRADPPARGSILFIGSSSIGRWDLEASFPGLDTLNRGFGGSHLSDVIHYADRVVGPYGPRLVVVYAGDNDIAGGKSAERVRDDFLQLARRLRKLAPDAPVLFLAIKPSPSRWHLWPEARRANDLIREACEAERRLNFIDVAGPLLGDDGETRPELYVKDGLHLGPDGYAIWAEVLRPSLGEGRATAP